uniref:Uncharacterized protein LOC102805685 n=1 Tax=Saccoglossus kowalevskii TaxID=10224 RepID=A0ABM0M4N7_SACKO|nr:PREDICTED: uncharacterized protein LOC102805685 [Saccoglossus kowalevskii]
MATGEVGSRWPSYPARLIVEPSGETQLRWTDFVTEFGEDYLGPELITHLENFYYKTPDPQDRKQCVRLLAALTLGKEVREKEKEKQAARSKLVVKRPNTAMPSLGGPRRKPPVSTHYTQEYPGIDVSRNTRPAEQRPSTTKNSYQAYHELNGRLGTPHYDEQFTWKPPSKREPIRAGSSSGNRRNNPHPHESFMVWKFPKGVPEDQKLYPSDLTDSMMDEICMDKCKSTYQDDYLGLPQGLCLFFQ